MLAGKREPPRRVRVNGTRLTIAVLGLFLLAWLVTVVVLVTSG